MGTDADLLRRIEGWEAEGLITAEQGAKLRERVAEEAGQARAQRVMATEILVYLGSLIVFLALAFLAILNWDALGSGGRIGVLLVPALAMFGVGWPMRDAADAQRRRGAQALWLGACLITGVLFLVIFNELALIDWQERGPSDFTFLLSCLLAGGVSGVAYALLPTVVQSLPFHFWLMASFVSFLGWLDWEYPPFNYWRTLALGLLVGALWLALGAWLSRQRQERLAAVSLLVGAVTALVIPFLLLVSDGDTPLVGGWAETAMEAILFLLCLLFIGASVRFQSRVLLYTGAIFLLFLITDINFEHFADDLGMPVALFLTGMVLIGLGLGTERLSRLMQRGIAPG